MTSIRFLLATVFFVAGGSKLVDLTSFLDSVRELLRIPRSVALLLSTVVIVSELLIGVTLFWWSSSVLPLLVAGVLLLIFAAITLNALARGQTVRCSCFGSKSELLSTRSLRRQGYLLVLVLVGIALEASRSEVFHPTISELLVSVMLTALMVIVGMFILDSDKVLAALNLADTRRQQQK